MHYTATTLDVMFNVAMSVHCRGINYRVNVNVGVDKKSLPWLPVFGQKGVLLSSITICTVHGTTFVTILVALTHYMSKYGVCIISLVIAFLCFLGVH